jgi:hypothetical protein
VILASGIPKILFIAIVSLIFALAVYCEDREEGLLWLKVINGAFACSVIIHVVRALL